MVVGSLSLKSLESIWVETHSQGMVAPSGTEARVEGGGERAREPWSGACPWKKRKWVDVVSKYWGRKVQEALGWLHRRVGLRQEFVYGKWGVIFAIFCTSFRWLLPQGELYSCSSVAGSLKSRSWRLLPESPGENPCLISSSFWGQGCCLAWGTLS